MERPKSEGFRLLRLFEATLFYIKFEIKILAKDGYIEKTIFKEILTQQPQNRF